MINRKRHGLFLHVYTGLSFMVVWPMLRPVHNVRVLAVHIVSASSTIKADYHIRMHSPVGYKQTIAIAYK